MYSQKALSIIKADIMESERYSYEKAQEEAHTLKKRVESGEVLNYDEAEQQLEEQERISLETARTKLEKLLDPAFDEFAIRFMNRDEYLSILKGGSTFYAEAYVFSKKNGNAVPFTEYLRKNAKHWQDPVFEQTQWESSCFDIRTGQVFFSLLRGAKKEAHARLQQQGQITAKTLRQLTMQIFQEKFSQYINYGIKMNGTTLKPGPELHYLVGTARIHGSYADVLHKLHRLKQYFETGKTPDLPYDGGPVIPTHEPGIYGFWGVGLITKENVDSLIEAYEHKDPKFGNRNENSETVADFLWNPDFLNDKVNLRRLLRATLYLDEERNKQSGESAQYHVGVVIDISSLMKGLREDLALYWDKWGRVEKGQSFLGAISMIPDKELIEKMKEAVEKAGIQAHPVFDRNGRVIYPTREKEI